MKYTPLKRKILLLLILCPFFAQSQYFSVGAMGGFTNYLGDLAPTALSPSATRPAVGIFAKFNIPQFFISLKAHYMRGSVAANDKHSISISRKTRNLHFRSHINEYALITEVNLLGFDPEGFNRRFSPYFYFGVAVFDFNPQAEYQNGWYDLQPLGTEGQGIPGFSPKYALTQLAIPLGAGIKFAITENITIGGEFGFRKLFTDYLDDVSTTYLHSSALGVSNGELSVIFSNRTGEFLNTEPIDYQTGAQRGDPKDNDWYLYGNIFIAYNLIFDHKGFQIFGNKGTGCRVF